MPKLQWLKNVRSLRPFRRKKVEDPQVDNEKRGQSGRQLFSDFVDEFSDSSLSLCNSVDTEPTLESSKEPEQQLRERSNKAERSQVTIGSQTPGYESMVEELQTLEEGDKPQSYDSKEPGKAIEEPTKVNAVQKQPVPCSGGYVKAQVTMKEYLPDQLWDEAYDQLKEEDRELVDSYERLLGLVFDTSNLFRVEANLPPENYIEQEDRGKRRHQMTEMLDKGLRRTEKEAEVKVKIDAASSAISTVRSLIERAAKASPEASIVWSSACLLIDILANPVEETIANRKGIAHVMSRMEWYLALSRTLLVKQVQPESPKRPGDLLRDQLEKSVTCLYKKLLSYQMKSVCSYYRNRGVAFLRDMVKLDDWDSALSEIKEAERLFKSDFAEYQTMEALSRLDELLRSATLNEEKVDRELSISFEKLLQEEQDNRCLADLGSTDPRHDKKRIEGIKGGLHRESSNWILEHESFRQWWSDSETTLLWIKGDPGKGKTMLQIAIIDALEKALMLSNSGRQLMFNGTALTYFFCQGTDTSLRTPTAVLKGLVYLLGDRYPALRRYVREQHDTGGKKSFEDTNAFIALRQIFESMLCDETLDKTVIIIDALDECAEDLEQLLDLIAEIAENKKYRAKWIVSSRNTAMVQRKLDPLGKRLSLELKANASLVSEAVDAYIRHKLRQMPSLKEEENLEQQVREIMHEKAEGTFLWAALAFEEITKVETYDVLDTLRDMPKGLYSLYDRMMSRIQKLEKRDSERCFRILAAATLAYRPLRLQEIGRIAGLADPIACSKENVRKIVRKCGSFLSIPDETDIVSLLHLSAQNYLDENASDILFPSGRDNGHYTMFIQSTTALSKTLRRNIYGLDGFGTSIEEIEAPSPDPLATIQYRCIYWIDHFCVANKDTKKIRGGKEIVTFLQKYFLYWLEALSLLRCYGEGVAIFGRLHNLVKQRYRSEQKLLDLIYDFRRFATENSMIIESKPMQIYASALIFSPNECMTRQLFRQEEPQWINPLPITSKQWNKACLYSIRNGGNVAAFSQDGLSLVACRNDEFSINVFDALTGKEARKAFRSDHKRVKVAVLSWDGRYVGTSGSDALVRVWDASTGKEIQALSGHSNPCSAIDFSRNGRYIASGADCAVKVWDIESGSEIQTLSGDSSSVRSVAFSPDGLHIAFGTSKSLIICITQTGKILHKLDNASGGVSRIVFSTDDNYVATGCYYGRVKIWNRKTGVQLRQLGGELENVISMAFSPDGSYLALLSSLHRTVKFWSTDNWTLVRTLYDVFWDAVHSITFSHDGRYMAVCSSDSTVKIWDVEYAIQKEIRPLQGWHTEDITAVAFHKDYIASGSKDHDIKLWDIATWKEVLTLQGHACGILQLAFSKDGRYLASLPRSGSVKVWDTTTGKEIQTLETYTSFNNGLAFSHDSRLIATVHRLEKTLPGNSSTKVFVTGIRIWDIGTGSCTKTLDSASWNLKDLAFSSDGRYLVHHSTDEFKKSIFHIWNIEDGSIVRSLEAGSSAIDAILSILLRVPYLSLDTTGRTRKNGLPVDEGIVSFNGIDGWHENQTTAMFLKHEEEARTGVPIYSEGDNFESMERKTWIMWNKKPVLWVPYSKVFMPAENMIWYSGAKVTHFLLADDTGKTTVLGMDTAGPSSP